MNTIDLLKPEIGFYRFEHIVNLRPILLLLSEVGSDRHVRIQTFCGVVSDKIVTFIR